MIGSLPETNKTQDVYTYGILKIDIVFSTLEKKE
jgi:hypothetical protein